MIFKTTEEFKCKSCGKPCVLIKETFDYSGTHCTHGQSGTHTTGYWISKCCLEDYEDNFKNETE